MLSWDKEQIQGWRTPLKEFQPRLCLRSELEIWHDDNFENHAYNNEIWEEVTRFEELWLSNLYFNPLTPRLEMSVDIFMFVFTILIGHEGQHRMFECTGAYCIPNITESDLTGIKPRPLIQSHDQMANESREEVVSVGSRRYTVEYYQHTVNVTYVETSNNFTYRKDIQREENGPKNETLRDTRGMNG